MSFAWLWVVEGQAPTQPGALGAALAIAGALVPEADQSNADNGAWHGEEDDPEHIDQGTQSPSRPCTSVAEDQRGERHGCCAEAGQHKAVRHRIARAVHGPTGP